jgi:hypothetical protein
MQDGLDETELHKARFENEEMENAEDRVIVSAIAVIACIVVAVSLILVFWCRTAHADEVIPKEVYCVIGEAEGEGEIGMEAVAEAIRNRGSLKGVYGCSAPRVRKHLYSARILRQAQQAWERSAGSGDITFGATHWEGTAFKTPYWAKDMIITATIRNQRFYKEKSNVR